VGSASSVAVTSGVAVETAVGVAVVTLSVARGASEEAMPAVRGCDAFADAPP
jgi:hypothetical protein